MSADGARVVLYDACPPALHLTGTRLVAERALRRSWAVGANTLWRAWATHVAPVTSWREALETVDDIAHETPGGVREVQFWGHGLEAAPYVGGERLTAADLHGWAGDELRSIGDASAHPPRWWFRTCYTARGSVGTKWCEVFAQALGGWCAGHTEVIGFPTHPGLRCVRVDDDGRAVWSLGVRSVPTWCVALPAEVCR